MNNVLLYPDQARRDALFQAVISHKKHLFQEICDTLVCEDPDDSLIFNILSVSKTACLDEVPLCGLVSALHRRGYPIKFDMAVFAVRNDMSKLFDLMIELDRDAVLFGRDALGYRCAEHILTSKNGPKYLKRLLAEGLPLNVVLGENETPLHCAVQSSSLFGVSKSLAAGCDPNFKDEYGRTPLHRLFLNERPYGKVFERILDTLLKHGANLDTPSSEGTPFELALKIGCSDIVLTVLAKNESEAFEDTAEPALSAKPRRL